MAVGHWNPSVAQFGQFCGWLRGIWLGTLALGGAFSFGMSRTMVLIYRATRPKLKLLRRIQTLFAYACRLFAGVGHCACGLCVVDHSGHHRRHWLSQTFYVLQDRPELGAEGAIRESWRLTWTNSNMLKVFFMSILSALVALGGLLALGVGLFFAIPLVSVMAGGLYEELRLAEGQTTYEEGFVEFV